MFQCFSLTGSIKEIFSFLKDYDPSQDRDAPLGMAGFPDAVRWIGIESEFEPFNSDNPFNSDLDERAEKERLPQACRASHNRRTAPRTEKSETASLALQLQLRQ